jgi:hypothetical protein
MRQRTKKQHYVSQAALRRFSSDRERIFVYDKVSNEVRISNIRDVAQQRYFYDIPKEVIPGDLQQRMDRQTIEQTLSQLEGDFNTVVERVLRKVTWRNPLRRFLDFITFRHGKIISRRDKEALCFFVALQYLRTREFRLTIRDGLDQFEAAIRKRIPAEQIDLFFEGFRAVNEVDVRMHHLSLMLNNEFVDELTALLNGHILVIGRNSSHHKLYSSDNPMVRQGHKRHPILRNIGIGSPGIEIAMPLSSDYILIFMEKTHFAALGKSDRKCVDLVEGNIEYYNTLQVRGCDRQVYCETDDFDLARDFCRRWPERCAEQRRRVVVE